MSSVVYLLRSPAEQMSPSLYTAAERDAIVIRIDPAAAKTSLQLAQIEQPGTMVGLRAGQSLTASELLELLLHAPKIVTL
jgi:hypothetical protein